MRELLFSLTKKDFEVQTFCAGGKGGQHQNKTASGVRIIHSDSGAVGESRNYRSQHQNKKAALHRLIETEKFKKWHKLKTNELLYSRNIESWLQEQLAAENVLVEVREKGIWKKEMLKDEN